MYEWLCTNKLSINIEKTNCIVFNGTETPKNLNISIANHVIDIVSNVKFSGVYIDENSMFNILQPNLEELYTYYIKLLKS